MFRGLHRAAKWQHACPICFEPTDGQQCGRHHVLPEGDIYRDLAHFLLVGAGLSPEEVRKFPLLEDVADTMARRLNPDTANGPVIPLPRLTARAGWAVTQLIRVPIHILDTRQASFSTLTRGALGIYVRHDGSLLVPRPPFDALQECVDLEHEEDDTTFGDLSWLDDSAFFHELGPYGGLADLAGA